MTTIDHRGSDLIIIPDEEMLRLPTPELLQALFGVHLPADIRAAIGRDKRHHFLRTQPVNFSAVKAEIERLLHRHASDQVILFSEYNQVVNEISRRFCLPSITYYMGL